MAALAARRLDATAVADMRALPIANGTAGAIVAFYSVIHLRRADLAATFVEFARALMPSGRLLVSAHEGQGEVTLTEFIGVPARLDATFFELDELRDAAAAAGLAVALAERRAPYATEGQTTRLYLLAERPRSYR